MQQLIVLLKQMSRNNYTSSSIIGNFYQQPNISKSPVKGLSYPLASSNPNSKYSGSMGNMSNTPKGLQNLTNTCYISAVLQILFQIINEKDFPIMNKYKQEVTYHFFILKDSKSKRDYENFKEVVEKRIEIVQGWQQQDAHQFLIHLLEQFRKQNSLPLKVGKTVNLNYNPSQNYQTNWQRFTNEMMKLQNSKIINMVSGDILKRFTCQRKHVKHNFERFNNISLHFPSSSYSYQQDPIPIQTMIQKYFGPEEIDDLFCEQCKYKTQFQKQASIFSAPKYLILHISRFSKGYFQSEKNKSEVKFNSSLFFNSFREKQAKYRLIGIVNHTGSLNRGHFYANVLISNEWYQMNDQSVYRETIKPKDNISSTVYMLVYQKQGK